MISVSKVRSLACFKVGKIGPWHISGLGAYMIISHILSIPAIYLILTGGVPYRPIITIFAALFGISAVGLSVGAHRLWSHRSFTANLPLRVLLMLCQTISGHDSILKWVRDHRLHHKYCGSDADPHNVKRGIFFAHMGWYLILEHPEVTEKEKTIDLTDLEKDSVVNFQTRYFVHLFFLVFHFIPMAIMYYSGASSIFAVICLNHFRHVLVVQVASLGNSIAHTWPRQKPYDKSIGPADVSWLSLIIAGEGWHNFHHVFPWDYRSTDKGLYSFNLATILIDSFAKIGWASDLKTASSSMIEKRAARTGDGSHSINHNKSKILFDLEVEEIGPPPWGWGDPDIPEDDIRDIVTIKRKKVSIL